MEFNQRLKELRLEKSWLQKDLAQKMNVKNNTVCYWESGAREPDIKTIKKLAQIFEVSAGYLLGLED